MTRAASFFAPLLLAALLTGCASPAPRPSTAGRGVSVLPAAFTIPGLNRQRTVRLYLPPSYDSSPDKRYPVVYMHDGQNLFDDATAYAGEWGVDETLNDLARRGQLEAIVVGIDNGGELRMRELNPFDHAEFGAGEGNAYVDFIAHTLKPEIDRRFRTLPGPAHTAIIGSSMGGLISDYAIRRHPSVFGRAGVISPAYWTADPGIYAYAVNHPLPNDTRVYYSMGGREGAGMLADVRRMQAMAAAQSPGGISTWLRIDPEAEHNEKAWRGLLPTVLTALFPPPTATEPSPSK